MSTTVRLIPEDIHTAASNLGQLGGSTSQSQETLSHSWARLDAGWDTYAEAEANALFHAAMEEMGRMAAMFSQMADALHQNSTLIEEADRENAARFSVEGAIPGTGGRGRPPGLAMMAPPARVNLTAGMPAWKGQTFGDPPPWEKILEAIVNFFRNLLISILGGSPTPTGTPTPGSTETPTPDPTQTPIPTDTPTPTPVIWPPLQTVIPHNQYAHYDDLDVMGCGIVSAAAAVEAIALDIETSDLSYNTIYDDLVEVMASYGFTKEGGIQPGQLENLLEQVLENQHGIPVQVYDEQEPEMALGQLRLSLAEGNQVIVDFVANDQGAGTMVQCTNMGDGGCPTDFSHFARVVGFSDDGQTIYLAETLTPGPFDPNSPDVPGQRDAVVGIPIDQFMASWYNPEMRVTPPPGVTPEPTGYWMLVISPPQATPTPTVTPTPTPTATPTPTSTP